MMPNYPFYRSLFLFLLAVSATAVIQAQPVANFDLYILDVKTGAVTQATDLPGMGEFNASFNNNGKLIVHDAITDTTHDLYITDLVNDTSYALPGGEGGNDAAWSPNGQYIAFDRLPAGDSSIYILPAGGGTPTLVRSNAIDPHWSQNSKRLVFVALEDSSVRTIETDGTGEEVISSLFGSDPFSADPVYSRNGKYIAGSVNGDIYTIGVNNKGQPTSSPVQLTNDTLIQNQPTWINNNKYLAFHSNATDSGDFDIFKISVSGGNYVQLVGVADSNDFDPSFSKNGQYIVYSAVVADSATGSSFAGPGQVNAQSFNFSINYPNPFEGETSIQIELPEEAEAELVIYNLQGGIVYRLVSDKLSAGTHTYQWDGRNEQGQAQPAGIYIYRLITPMGTETRKMYLQRN